MNYLDIKHQVIEVTSNLEHGPMYLVEQYLQNQWELQLVARNALDTLGSLRHPSIKCVVHCMMHYDTRRIHTVRSVLVDDVPAFFYIAGGREGNDYYTAYTLSTDAMKQYIKYLAVLAIDTWYQESTGYLPEYLPEVEDTDIQDEDVVRVTETTTIRGLIGKGIQYKYGVPHNYGEGYKVPPMRVRARSSPRRASRTITNNT